MDMQRIIQAIVAVSGLVIAVATFWLGDIFDWTTQTEVVVATLIAVGTIIVELTLEFSSLKENITRLYPSLNFSVQEQKDLYELTQQLNDLKKRQADPGATVAIDLFENAREVINCAYSGNDYQIDNMFQANMLALSKTQPGQRFLGISSIINPDHWRYDPSLRVYRDLNYSKALSGTLIYRTFMFHNESEYKLMLPVMKEQVDKGIIVKYVYWNDLQGLSLFPDFTILPDNQFSLYVPKLEKLLTVVVSTNKDTITRLEADFDRLDERANEVPSSKFSEEGEQ